MKRVHLIITGDVQGIGFRAWMRTQARSLSITGWVKNRSDGTVEAVCEGNPESISKLIELSQQGPEMGWVEEVVIKRERTTGEFVSFEIVYD